VEKNRIARCSSLSPFRLFLTGLCRDGWPRSKRKRLLRLIHRPLRVPHLARLKPLKRHRGGKQFHRSTIRAAKLFGTKWMENGNGGRVIRPTLRVCHPACPRTENSNGGNFDRNLSITSSHCRQVAHELDKSFRLNRRSTTFEKIEPTIHGFMHIRRLVKLCTKQRVQPSGGCGNSSRPGAPAGPGLPHNISNKARFPGGQPGWRNYALERKAVAPNKSNTAPKNGTNTDPAFASGTTGTLC